MRPYLGRKGILNTDYLFDQKSDGLNNMLKSKNLKAVLGTVEFDQLLFEANLKTRSCLNRLNQLASANDELIVHLKRAID